MAYLFQVVATFLMVFEVVEANALEAEDLLTPPTRERGEKGERLPARLRERSHARRDNGTAKAKAKAKAKIRKEKRSM